jgi:hypothetical protein
VLHGCTFHPKIDEISAEIALVYSPDTSPTKSQGVTVKFSPFKQLRTIKQNKDLVFDQEFVQT